MTPSPSGRPRALIVISSATRLPLSQPASHPGISTGFFLIELAQVLKEFGDDYEFTFATPDGRTPQLDVNGLALAFHAVDRFTTMTVSSTVSQTVGVNPNRYRDRHADLAARREAELVLAHRHLGRLPVSDPLPSTDREVRQIRDRVADDFAALPAREFLSLEQLVNRHRDADDPLSIGDFDFVHMPGGHAPMVDFHDNPWMGELLHVLREQKVLISLICHAPVALTSARYRVDADGQPVVDEAHAFHGAQLTTVPKHGEIYALTSMYPHIPGRRTRLDYYVDVMLRRAGYDVRTTANPAAAKVVWESRLRLLTGNGPQAVDEQAARIRQLCGRPRTATRPSGLPV